MRILILLLAMCLPVHATYIKYLATNVFYELDTNQVIVRPIGSPINANGTFVTRGPSFRLTPDQTTNVQAGNYIITNATLGTNIFFAVPTDSTTNIYLIGDLAISGYNTYNYTPGVRTLTAGDNITLSGTTGNITISSSGGGTSGALTNNDTRNVSLLGETITLGNNSQAQIVVDDLSTEIRMFGDIRGSGLYLTNIPGSGIQSSTISSNKLDATAYVAFKNDVTAAGLAAGSHPIAETALTGAFGFSSTNTFFAVNTNAITIATNVVSYNTNSITVTDCPTNAFNVTWYWNSAKDAYTNSTLGSHGLSLACDIPESPGDPAITNGSGGTVFFGLGYDPVNGNSPGWSYPDYNQAGTMQTLFGENFGYTPRHIGNFIGDGSAITNISLIATNLTFPVNGVALVGDAFAFQTTNSTQPAKIIFESDIHGAGKGVLILGGVSGDVVINPGQSDNLLQIGATDNRGHSIYMQRAVVPTSTYTNGFSHALQFRSSHTNNAGGLFYKYPSIMGLSAPGAGREGQLLFYSATPEWNSSNPDFNNPTTAGNLSMTVASNGIIAASNIPFRGQYQVLTNTSSAPTAAGSEGWLWNSNRVLYWTTSVKTTLVSDGR